MNTGSLTYSDTGDKHFQSNENLHKRLTFILVPIMAFLLSCVWNFRSCVRDKIRPALIPVQQTLVAAQVKIATQKYWKWRSSTHRGFHIAPGAAPQVIKLKDCRQRRLDCFRWTLKLTNVLVLWGRHLVFWLLNAIAFLSHVMVKWIHLFTQLQCQVRLSGTNLCTYCSYCTEPYQY